MGGVCEIAGDGEGTSSIPFISPLSPPAPHTSEEMNSVVEGIF